MVKERATIAACRYLYCKVGSQIRHTCLLVLGSNPGDIVKDSVGAGYETDSDCDLMDLLQVENHYLLQVLPKILIIPIWIRVPCTAQPLIWLTKSSD